jgi:hypothetical protein
LHPDYQYTPNGNISITEAQAGRVFEINTNGKVLWDWIRPHWDEYNILEISEGIRYRNDFSNFIVNFKKIRGSG